ncbi:hypothetical protein KR51_00017990 [Rubidibacter lacunae KORDI 51-2]|uniref:Uncharacterized protein n=1 Tax=Rubidibacter lacunae KORDI 51-2 TaxID=582515 RepID=U5DPF7_9CHRO|nr:hypothetical protein KR51_00017990 [Rubidibacter lacunae KORDI 51-2]
MLIGLRIERDFFPSVRIPQFSLLQTVAAFAIEKLVVGSDRVAYENWLAAIFISIELTVSYQLLEVLRQMADREPILHGLSSSSVVGIIRIGINN